MAINLAPMAVELSLKNKTNGDSFPILALGHLFSKQGTFERRDVIHRLSFEKRFIARILLLNCGSGEIPANQQNPANDFILLNGWP
jgi:hypothetical protein